MPIAVSCPGCGDRYDLGDDLAGRRCRCKGCGTVFRVPEPHPAAMAAGPFAGLDDGPALPRTYAATAKPYASAYEPELPPPPRGPKPTRSRPSRRRSRDAEESDPLFRFGWALMSFSLLMLVLPMIGLQWAIINVLPPHIQVIVFCISFFVGGILLTASSPSATWERVAKALGVALFALVMIAIGIIFGVGFYHGFRAANQPPPPTIVLPAPVAPQPFIIQQPMPHPNPMPMPGPPNIPRFQPPQRPAMPGRGFPGRPDRF